MYSIFDTIVGLHQMLKFATMVISVAESCTNRPLADRVLYLPLFRVADMTL